MCVYISICIYVYALCVCVCVCVCVCRYGNEDRIIEELAQRELASQRRVFELEAAVEALKLVRSFFFFPLKLVRSFFIFPPVVFL